MAGAPPHDSQGPTAPGAGDGGRKTGDLLARALDDLAREIRARFVDAPPRAREAAADWPALFDELRSHLRTLGMRERAGEVDEYGLDPEFLARARPLLDFLRRRWWRVEARGAEALDEKPTLFVANRAGLLPWDGLMIAQVVANAVSEQARPRFLVADWLITLPFAQARLARVGGVRACRENAVGLLTTGRSVVAFPEGQKGAAKVFRERYRLKRFGRGGVVRVALETGVPLMPVAVVGAEEVHPILFKVEMLARSAGLPFVPVTPTFPLLGPLGAIPLPSKWSIRFGEPLATGDLGPEAAGDELLVSRMTEELRSAIQSMLDADRRARGGIFS